MYGKISTFRTRTEWGRSTSHFYWSYHSLHRLFSVYESYMEITFPEKHLEHIWPPPVNLSIRYHGQRVVSIWRTCSTSSCSTSSFLQARIIISSSREMLSTSFITSCHNFTAPAASNVHAHSMKCLHLSARTLNFFEVPALHYLFEPDG